MSKKIMWGVYGPSSLIPYGFFHSKGKAELGGATLWNIRHMRIVRVMVELKDKVHYDIYKHETKIIEEEKRAKGTKGYHDVAEFYKD